MLGIVLALVPALPLSLTALRNAYPHLSPDGRMPAFNSNRSGMPIVGAEGKRLFFYDNVGTGCFEIADIARIEFSPGD